MALFQDILTCLHTYYIKLITTNIFVNFQPERDPNAPKKPCNAFFQFCQEQRPVVVAEANSDIGAEPTKQEVTRQLASRWRALTNDEKRASLNISFNYCREVTLRSELCLYSYLYVSLNLFSPSTV